MFSCATGLFSVTLMAFNTNSSNSLEGTESEIDCATIWLASKKAGKYKRNFFILLFVKCVLQGVRKTRVLFTFN